MRFAAQEWLWSLPFALIIAGLFVLQGFRITRARRRFGQPEQLAKLVGTRTGIRRTISAILVTLGVAAAGLAAAGPQYGQGTRVLPATNLDVIIVLDYSKSMYARDVPPSRIERAKIEVRRLVHELAGARFGAVAFAGDTLSFPLTSDGAAIAQFFQGIEPNDMPLGGTAIARALEAGRQLLARDPLSERHERVIVLVTDGEDLEGDPVAAAESAAADGVRLEIVQVGGTSPEPIPNVTEDGRVEGMRRDHRGRIMTTSLSPEGEAQLQRMAEAGGGSVVRAAEGSVGIDTVTSRLRRLMTEELSERVETVFADIYHWPLLAAIALLLIECFVGTAGPRKWEAEPPIERRPRRLPKRAHAATTGLLLLVLPGCQTFDSLFERNSPVVNEAIGALDAERYDEATELLTSYLETGPCEDGVIGAGERARALGDASFDLALAQGALHRKQAGKQQPSGGPKAPAPMPPLPTHGSDQDEKLIHAPHVDCALLLLTPVAENPKHPTALRARAHYLAGNLELERGEYESAVDFYDQALLLAPGQPEEAGDPIGRDAAYNRAVALRLLQAKRQQEQEQEQQQNSNQDSEQNDAQDEDGKKDQQDDPQGDQDDGKKDDPQGDQDDGKKDDPQGDQDDGKKDRPSDQPGDRQDEPEPGDQGEQPADSSEQDRDGTAPTGSGQPNPSASQDQRILDLLEQAPTLQQHNAKQRSRGRRPITGMEDK